MSSPRLSILDVLLQQQGRHTPTKHPGSKSHHKHVKHKDKQRRRNLRLRRQSDLRDRVASSHPERIEDEV